MKIRPVILCGGAGTRLWPQSKKNFQLNSLLILVDGIYSGNHLKELKIHYLMHPIISTNLKYLKNVKKNLKRM